MVRKAASAREQEVLDLIKTVLVAHRNKLSGHTVVLFGSRAEGCNRERSDFDIGIIGDNPLPAAVLHELEDALEALPALYRIELVDLATVAPRFRDQALRHTEVLLNEEGNPA